MSPRVAVTDPGSVRERVTARVLREASARASSKVQRFLDAGYALVRERGSCMRFTVEEVVERSGQSLRSFYGCFSSREHLLLVMLEDSIRSNVAELHALARAEPDPRARLRLVVLGHHAACSPNPVKPWKPMMPELLFDVLRSNPTAGASVLQPLVDLYDTACEGVWAGSSREHAVSTMLQLVMFDSLSQVIAGSTAIPGDRAVEVWALIEGGLISQNTKGTTL